MNTDTGSSCWRNIPIVASVVILAALLNCTQLKMIPAEKILTIYLTLLYNIFNTHALLMKDHVKIYIELIVN